eukprot:TCONS_00056767-protein
MFQGQRSNGRGRDQTRGRERSRGKGRGHVGRVSSRQQGSDVGRGSNTKESMKPAAQRRNSKPSVKSRQKESHTKEDHQQNQSCESKQSNKFRSRKQKESQPEKTTGSIAMKKDYHKSGSVAGQSSGKADCILSNSFGCENINWSSKELIKFCEKNFVMFIMRGVPGSGKSTLAQKVKSFYGGRDAIICSADDYRYNRKGEYIFSVDQLYKTHLQCQNKAETYCSKQIHVIIIDNTNIHSKDCNPYLTLAKKYNYFVIFLKMKAQGVDHHVQYNTHQVPRDTIAKMILSYGSNPLPYYFNWAVPNSEGVRLRNVTQRLIQSCMKADSHFSNFLTNEMKTSSQNLFKTFHLQNASSHHYHATVAYTNQYNVPTKISDKYTKSATVKNALGSVTFLQIAGVYITPKCIAARLLLTEEQKKLWGRNDSLNRGEINPIAFESNKVMEGSLEKMLCDLHLNNKHMNEDTVTFQVPPGCTEPSHSLGCTAHITLGTRGNNKPVIAKDTLYQIVHLEAYTLPKSETLTSGNLVIRCYGDDKWVIYFRHPFIAQALFCGHYDLMKNTGCPKK